MRILAGLLATAAFAAQGIVSTAPGFTESLFALGLGDRVVAVSQYCDYPPAVGKLPRVGSYLQPGIEAIARLQPELVLMQAEQKQAVARLRAMGLEVLALRNTGLDETLHSIREIANAAGVAARGDELERSLRSRLAAIERRTEGAPRRSLLFVVGRTPGRLEGMIAVGKGSFLNELIRIAGGRNVLADSPVAYPRISMEAVMRLDPDVIVDMGDMAETAGVTELHKRSVVRLWETQAASLRAAARGQVHAVAAGVFVAPGPRVVEAAEAFEKMLRAVDKGRP